MSGDRGAAPAGAGEPDRQRGQVLAARARRSRCGAAAANGHVERRRRPTTAPGSRPRTSSLIFEQFGRVARHLEARHRSRPLHLPRDRRGARRHARGQRRRPARARRSRSTLPSRRYASPAAARAVALQVARALGDARRAARAARAMTASPRNESTSPTSHSALPTGRSESGGAVDERHARPSRPPSAPTAGEYQMRAVVASRSSAGSKPSRGVKPLPQQLRRARAVEAVAPRRVAVDVPGVDVPVRQPALDRVRLDRARLDLGRLGLQVLELDEPVVGRSRASAWRRGPPRRPPGASGVCASSNCAERLLELRADAVERRVRAGRDHRADELEREPDRARLERRQPRRPGGTCRRRAPCRRAPRRRAARRRRRSSRRRS